MLLTLVGIALCFVWRRQGDVVHASEVPVSFWSRRSPEPDTAAEMSDTNGDHLDDEEALGETTVVELDLETSEPDEPPR
jgi:hypothetical protein